MSSYADADGSTQTVASGGNFAFDTDPVYLDIVGSDITLDPTGTVFSINRAGLYHVEWNVNLQSGDEPVVICLLEDGEPTSLAHSSVTEGSCSSGALIYVTEAEVPYTVSLHNFGGEVTVSDPPGYEDTAISIRILRFADAPN